MTASLRLYDETLLRRAFDAAKCARDAGDHPFGAVLADYEGKVLMEQGSGFTSEGGDRTGHAVAYCEQTYRSFDPGRGDSPRLRRGKAEIVLQSCRLADDKACVLI